MTERFPGSRSLDDRRRRRLAMDRDDRTASDKPSASQKAAPGSATVEMPRVASHFPVRKAISPRWWKIWGVGVLGLLATAGILAGSEFAATHAELLGPGFVRLFGLPEARAASFLSTMQLILTGQLALFIWSIRSRSLRDFQGRYQIWIWVAMAALGCAFSVVADAHLALSETIGWLWTGDLWNKEVISWLAPAAVVAIALFGMLHRDMRDCRSSLMMLWLGAVSGVCWAVMQLGIELPVAFGERTVLVQTGIAMLCSLCLFMSLLLHARYVVYMSPEPPENRPSRFKRRLARLVFGGRDRHRQPAVEEDSTNPSRAAKALETPKASRKKSASAKAKPRNEKVAVAEPESEPEVEADEIDDYEPPKERRRKKPRRKQEDVDYSQDDEDMQASPDPELLKGLSKRERRKVRKQFRDDQRAKKRSA